MNRQTSSSVFHRCKLWYSRSGRQRFQPRCRILPSLQQCVLSAKPNAGHPLQLRLFLQKIIGANCVFRSYAHTHGYGQCAFCTEKFNIRKRFVKAKPEFGSIGHVAFLSDEHQVAASFYICTDDRCLCEQLTPFLRFRGILVLPENIIQQIYAARRLFLKQVVQSVFSRSALILNFVL